MLRSMLAFAGLCAFSSAAMADILFVPAEYATIQEAVDAASSGDTILVSPGTYAGNFSAFDTITILGAGATPSETVIAGDFQFDEGRLENFRVTGTLYGAAGLLVTDCEFVGGRVEIDNGYADFIDTLFMDCHSRAVNCSLSSFDFLNCDFISNSSTGNGGALFLDDTNASFIDCSFVGNSADGSGGAIATGGFAADLELIRCEFDSNTAVNNAGAILSSNANFGTCLLEDCSFIENASGGSAGAVAIASDPESNPGSVTRCAFEGNTAGSGGGALWFDTFLDVEATVTDSSFCANTPNDIVGDYTSGGGNTFSSSCPCLADVNHDGKVTPADFTAWVAAFNANAPECDQNSDGMCTPADFNAWITNFNAGC